MLALTLINLCSREYQDVAFARIAKAPSGNNANWLDWLNDAQRAVVAVRPDANSITQSVLLIAGTRQTLPSSAQRLLDVTRNTGVAGVTPGRTVRLSERRQEDEVNRDWHTAATGTVVKDVYYDEKKDPTVFWVRPGIPASPAVYLEIIYSKAPTDVTDADAGSITLLDTYAPAMQAWMLARAFGMATQAQNQFQRSQYYMAMFMQLLGVKLRADVMAGILQPPTYPTGAAAK